MIPADLRLIVCKDLHVNQASLTGESFPVEKTDAPEAVAGRSPVEMRNVCFLGASVESGTARGMVVATGRDSYLGSMAEAITQQQVETSFDKGISQFTWLMLRFMVVMVP